MKKAKVMMMTLMMCLMTMVSFGQITTKSIANTKDIIDNTPYDSLSNFLGEKVYQYINQELYLLPKSEDLRRYGYSNFYNYYNKSTVLVNIGSKYDELSGKYFIVLNIHKHPKSDESIFYKRNFYLELKNKENGDILYYEYNSEYEYGFPFLVVGYFLKQKDLVVGKQILTRGDNWISRDKPMSDIETGEPVKFERNQIWECVDLTVEEKYYTLTMVLKNELNEKIILPLSSFKNTHFRSNWGVHDYEDVKNYIKKYGKDNWETILDGKVKIGFTEEMVILSWGAPKKINRSSYSDQWVYDEQYLYFEGGKLKSFN